MRLLRGIMNFKNTDTHYNTLSVALHWLMFILIVTVYGSTELRELFDKGPKPVMPLKCGTLCWVYLC